MRKQKKNRTSKWRVPVLSKWTLEARKLKPRLRNLSLSLKVKWILMTANMRLKWLTIRPRLIATVSRLIPQKTLLKTSWKTIRRKSVSAYNTSVRAITTSAVLKKRPFGNVKSWRDYLNNLWKRIRNSSPM